MPPLSHYLILAAGLFAIGVVGVVTRRNALVIFMSVELMLNAVNLTFLAFGHFRRHIDAQVFGFLVMALAAAEVAIGLAIIVTVFRGRASLQVDEADQLRG
ncbi:MAG TPA: NADH-quinone oxidoreductase subunit NuoK [Acidobacteriota bacterium]|jgi:NADH-quinone oxidoreductase subunit K